MAQPSSLDHEQDGGAPHRAVENQDLQLKQFSQATAEGKDAAVIRNSDKGSEYQLSYRVIDW
jgi:hypothetical protein